MVVSKLAPGSSTVATASQTGSTISTQSGQTNLTEQRFKNISEQYKRKKPTVQELEKQGFEEQQHRKGTRYVLEGDRRRIVVEFEPKRGGTRRGTTISFQKKRQFVSGHSGTREKFFTERQQSFAKSGDIKNRYYKIEEGRQIKLARTTQTRGGVTRTTQERSGVVTGRFQNIGEQIEARKEAKKRFYINPETGQASTVKTTDDPDSPYSIALTREEGLQVEKEIKKSQKQEEDRLAALEQPKQRDRLTYRELAFGPMVPLVGASEQILEQPTVKEQQIKSVIGGGTIYGEQSSDLIEQAAEVKKTKITDVEKIRRERYEQLTPQQREDYQKELERAQRLEKEQKTATESYIEKWFGLKPGEEPPKSISEYLKTSVFGTAEEKAQQKSLSEFHKAKLISLAFGARRLLSIEDRKEREKLDEQTQELERTVLFGRGYGLGFSAKELPEEALERRKKESEAKIEQIQSLQTSIDAPTQTQEMWENIKFNLQEAEFTREAALKQFKQGNIKTGLRLTKETAIRGTAAILSVPGTAYGSFISGIGEGYEFGGLAVERKSKDIPIIGEIVSGAGRGVKSFGRGMRKEGATTGAVVAGTVAFAALVPTASSTLAAVSPKTVAIGGTAKATVGAKATGIGIKTGMLGADLALWRLETKAAFKLAEIASPKQDVLTQEELKLAKQGDFATNVMSQLYQKGLRGEELRETYAKIESGRIKEAGALFFSLANLERTTELYGKAVVKPSAGITTSQLTKIPAADARLTNLFRPLNFKFLKYPVGRRLAGAGYIEGVGGSEVSYQFKGKEVDPFMKYAVYGPLGAYTAGKFGITVARGKAFQRKALISEQLSFEKYGQTYKQRLIQQFGKEKGLAMYKAELVASRKGTKSLWTGYALDKEEIIGDFLGDLNIWGTGGKSFGRVATPSFSFTGGTSFTSAPSTTTSFSLAPSPSTALTQTKTMVPGTTFAVTPSFTQVPSTMTTQVPSTVSTTASVPSTVPSFAVVPSDVPSFNIVPSEVPSEVPSTTEVPSTVPATVIGGFPFFWPGGGDGTLRGRGVRGRPRRGFGYTASFEAKVRGIYGKVPATVSGLFTGQEFRPILGAPPTKKRKKKTSKKTKGAPKTKKRRKK